MSARTDHLALTRLRKRRQFKNAKTYDVSLLRFGSKVELTVKAYNRSEARGAAKRLLGIRGKGRLPAETKITLTESS